MPDTTLDEKSLETHFEFGRNWLDFLQHVDAAAVSQAESGLLKLIAKEELEGARFLDIGCGSGLHSLVALQAGAREVVAIDVDPNSVEAARRVLAGASNARVEVCSIFDASPDTLGEFDVVYSWGVLHHTGAMWEAVEGAMRLVKPGGLFAIALYQKTPLCGAWRAEKRFYTAAAEPIRAVVRGAYKAAFRAGLLASGRSPASYIRDYHSARGMNWHNDVHDWLGGYPYESASPEEILHFFDDHDFSPCREFPLHRRIGVLGAGCAEFVFRKRK
jgi:2-polyprenyl-6-hydroxyphenyl methylase/3-demethylubiquinone-9 3-methyltransferase